VQGAAAASDDGRLSPDVIRVAVVVIVGAIMSILDTTIVNVALETLARDLNTSLATIQWVATAYLLALATVIPLTGWAAERFGPRRVWMTVVAGFVVTSALCGLAWSAESLIAFRVLQGLAGGMIMPIGMITLAQAAGPKRVGRVMSVVGVPMLLGPALGPLLGGLIVTDLSWRWIFYVNLPIGVLGLVLAARLLPEGRAQGRQEGPGQLDWRGLAMLSPGVALIVFGLSEVSTHGSVTVVRLLPIVAGVTLTAGFVARSRRLRAPVVDVRLFDHRGFAAAGVTVFLVGASLFAALLLLPLYFQLARGLSPVQAGLLMAPQGLAAAVGMNRAGRLTDRIGGGPVVVGGLLILALGTVAFTQVRAGTSYWLLEASLMARGVGLGFSMMPAMAAAYATLERSQVPRATPMLNVLQRVGGSLGTAMVAVVLQHELVARVGGGLSAARSRTAGGAPLAAAFAHTYWWVMASIVVAMVPALVLARTQRVAARRESADRAAAATSVG
jgi:EmrB/QacA subfamily drug resistance transporter